MQKSNLGISIGMLGALVYFSGLLGSVTLAIVAGYILLKEENVWLRRAALKAVLIVVLFSILPIGVTAINQILAIPAAFIQMFMQESYFSLSIPTVVSTTINNICIVAQDLFLLACSIKAFNQKFVNISFVDNLVSEHIG